MVIFNMLVGNGDAHGKNYSVLYRPGGVTELAPAYDVLSTAIYPGFDTTMAMKIGDVYEFRALNRQKWQRFAEEAGVGFAALSRLVLGMAGRLPAQARACVASNSRFSADTETIPRIIDCIDERCSAVTQQMRS